MFAAALIAAAALAPSGTSPIQAYPVCLGSTVYPGHSYSGFSIYNPAGEPLTVTPAHDGHERMLNQASPSWVTFSGSGSETQITLTIPPGAATGAYWSDIRAGAPGGSGDVSLGTAATAALVFTVGPTPVPPPPCDALDLAYRTGKFPAWPGPEYATTSWRQVGEQDARYNPKPLLSPTAGTGVSIAPAVPAAAWSPAANAASAASAPPGQLPKIPSDWPGWLILIGLGLLIVAGFLKWLRS